MSGISYSQKIEAGKIIMNCADYSSLDSEFIAVIDKIKNFCTTLERLKPKTELNNLRNNLRSLAVILFYI